MRWLQLGYPRVCKVNIGLSTALFVCLHDTSNMAESFQWLVDLGFTGFYCQGIRGEVVRQNKYSQKVIGQLVSAILKLSNQSVHREICIL